MNITIIIILLICCVIFLLYLFYRQYEFGNIIDNYNKQLNTNDIQELKSFKAITMQEIYNLYNNVWMKK